MEWLDRIFTTKDTICCHEKTFQKNLKKWNKLMRDQGITTAILDRTGKIYKK